MGSDFSLVGLLSGLSPTTLAIITTAVTTVLTVSLLTRFTSGRPESKRDGGSVPFLPGYWLPYLGHALQMVWDTDGFLARMRDRSPLGAFSVIFSGRTYTFVHKPSMVAALMEETHAAAVDDERLDTSIDGFSKEERSQAWFLALQATYERLAAGPILKQLVDATVHNLRSHIVDLVTFNSYPSDQMEWERFADADIVETPDGQRHIEVDLVPLIKNFVAKTANPALFGTDFDKNLDEVPQLLWAYEALFPPPSVASSTWPLPGWLAAWVPRPAIQKARRARRTLLLSLEEFHDAWDKFLAGEEPGIRWQDLDDVSTLVKERIKVFRDHGVPIRTRAAADLALLWDMHAKAAPLTFWMLYEILRDPVLVQQIRDETAPHLRAVQPKNEFSLGVWVPPRVEHLDLEALVTQCPLLKSTYVETMRLYTDAWSGRRLSKRTVLGAGEGEGEDRCVLDEGDSVYVSHGLHHLDPRYFPEPKEWQGARHVKESVDDKGRVSRTADFGTIWPFGELALHSSSHSVTAQ